MASDAGMAALTGERDYDRTKRELQAAGYKDEKIVLMVPSDVPFLNAASDVAADMMKRAGMNVDYQAVDWGTAVQRRASKNPPAHAAGTRSAPPSQAMTSSPQLPTCCCAAMVGKRGPGGRPAQR